MRTSLYMKALLVLMVLAAPTVWLGTKAEAGTVWLVVGDPASVPRSGETFETPLQFTTWDAVLGAYLLLLFYDPNAVQIQSITSPSQSEFTATTFVDTGSFTTGSTTLAAFQTTNSSARSTLTTFATVQWKAVGAAGTSTKITIQAENVVDDQPRAIEVITAGLTTTLGGPSTSAAPPPTAGGGGGGGGGGGCAMNPGASFDPTLPGILVLLLVAIGWKCLRPFQLRRSSSDF